MWDLHVEYIIRSYEQKGHVAPHFDHLDAQNAMMPLYEISWVLKQSNKSHF